MRIWHVIENYPPDYGGGAAITTRDICHRLAAQGHEVRVLCGEAADREPYSLRSENDRGVCVQRVNLPYHYLKDPDGWALGWRAWRAHERRIATLIDELLDEWRPDLVDYHTARPLGEECLFVIARHGVPIMATMHEGWLVCPRMMWLQSPTGEACTGAAPLRCLECLYSHYDGSHTRSTLKLPWRVTKLGFYPAWRLLRRKQARHHISAVLARSEFIARLARPQMEGDVRHISLGLDLTGLPSIRPSRPHDPFRFGFVAGFQPNKGIWHVLDAAATLKREGLSFELHIWGPGGEQGLKDISQRNLTDRVFLRGIYRTDQCWNVYNEMDIALMATTVCEPHGRIPYEARAVGAPTIAPAVGGILDSIRSEVDGLLYRFRESDDLARQMRRVLVEPGLFKRLVSNLLPVDDIQTRVAEIEQFYLEILDHAHKMAV